jgi:putative flavoprotein involved in K+ transport
MNSDGDHQVHAVVGAWVKHLNIACQNPSTQHWIHLFEEDSHWREVIALTWTLSTTSGREQIAQNLAQSIQKMQAKNFCIDPLRQAPRVVERAGERVIEAILSFETKIGHGAALVRLKYTQNSVPPTQAWTFHTTLESIHGHEENTIKANRADPVFNRDFNGPNWLDRRTQAQRFEDREPTVLIVGGGHAGLSVAARLVQLGVDCLVIDKFKRIGDNWRLRYQGLMLHNQVHSNHLPYMPYPSTWQAYLPKDRIANWLEMYVDCMDIACWTGTCFDGASYDPPGQRWNAKLRLKDGQIRVMHPKHIIMATSVSGTPHIPHIPTLDQFKGQVVHSSKYAEASQWKNRPVLIVGTGTSAHDIAQDLHAHGARVSMLQRNSTLVVNVEPSAQLYDGLYLGEGPSLEDRDLINTSMSMKLMLATHKRLTDQAKIHDRPILDALAKVGFKLNDGIEGTGWPFLFRTRGGGYYFNVGCSDLIANGEIKILQNSDLEMFLDNGVKMKDGRLLDFDTVVLATGYKTQSEILLSLFGEEMAQKVGEVWGFDTQKQELKNMWSRTAQPGLWFTGGAFSQCRAYSKYLALQIKATELGLIEH